MKYEKGTFVTVPNREFLKGLTPLTQTLFFWICNYADENGQCFPSRTTLAKNMGSSIKTVDRHLKKLEEVGLVVTTERFEKGEKITNLYQIMILEGVASQSPYLASQSRQGSVTESLGVASQSRQGSVTESHRSKHILSKPILTKYNEEEGTDKTPIQIEKEINMVAEMFSVLNKDWRTFFIPGPQRSSIKKLIGFAKEDGLEIKELIQMAKDLHGVEYSPQIFSPTDMVAKYSKLVTSVNPKKTKSGLSNLGPIPEKGKYANISNK